MIPNFSTAKSPQQMMGAMVKTYYAHKSAIDPAKIYSVSIMPCTAKKYENGRDKTMFASGQKDVDVTLTTRELARMIKQAGIDLLNLPDSEPDSPLGPNTGAGVIFGATGGVMEAALAYRLQPPHRRRPQGRQLHRRPRDLGHQGGERPHQGPRRSASRSPTRWATSPRCSIWSGRPRPRARNVPWHFIEVMACRGGCIGGGGQPYGCTDDVRKMRIRGIYDADEASEYRCSHQNPYIKQVYAEFLEAPGSHKAHELLHTHYESKPLYLK